MSNSVINLKIKVSEVPKDHYFKGEKYVFLNCTVAEKREPDQFKNTHSVSIKLKDGTTKYIGDGVLKVFESKPLTDDDLPPGIDDVEDAVLEF